MKNKLIIALVIALTAIFVSAQHGIGPALLLPPPVDFQTCGGEAVLPAQIEQKIADWKAQGCTEFHFKDVNYVDGSLLGYGIRINLAP